MPSGQGDNHERDPVTTGEILPVLAVDGVAQPLTLRPVDLRFGQQPKISRGGQRDILQRQADPRTRPGLVASADGGDDGQRGVQATAHIPGRQHVVDRTGMIGRTGDERKPDTRVDRVVHPGGTVAAPEQLNVDHVGTLGGQQIDRSARTGRRRWSRRCRRPRRSAAGPAPGPRVSADRQWPNAFPCSARSSRSTCRPQPAATAARRRRRRSGRRESRLRRAAPASCRTAVRRRSWIPPRR